MSVISFELASRENSFVFVILTLPQKGKDIGVGGKLLIPIADSALNKIECNRD
jgi:hypothetical protein